MNFLHYSVVKQLCFYSMFTFVNFFLFGAYSSLSGQDTTGVLHPCQDHSFCAIQDELSALYNQSPNFEAQCKENCSVLLNEVFLSLVNDSVFNDSIVIPVVFHVLYGCENSIENISDERIFAAIDKVNLDFRGRTACENDSTCDVVYPERMGNLNIQFKLAEKDPDGFPTMGITRTKTNVTYLGWGNDPRLKRVVMWPRDQYLNVYIVNKVTPNDNSGIAFYPETSHDNPLITQDDENFYYDGVTMAHWAVAPIDSNRFNYSYVLSHEIGHWMGLRHIWGDLNSTNLSSNCEVDDFDFIQEFLLEHPSVIPDSGSVADAMKNFNDTPYSRGHNIRYADIDSCVPTDKQNTCDALNDEGVDEIDMYDNFMDYTPCAKMFSEGQALYMQNVLNSSVADRNKLHTPENLATVFYNTTIEERVVFVQQAFNEDESNVGSFSTGVPLNLQGLTFNQTTGTLAEADFIVTGLPSGLIPNVEIYSGDSAVLFLDGAALTHQQDTEIKIVFLPSAFAETVTTPKDNRSKILDINFIEEEGLEYTNLSGQYNEVYKVGPSSSSFQIIETKFGPFNFSYEKESGYFLNVASTSNINFAVEANDENLLHAFNIGDTIANNFTFKTGDSLQLPAENLMDGDQLLIGLSINSCGYDNFYGYLRFEKTGGNILTGNGASVDCASLQLVDIVYSSVQSLVPIAGILPEPTLRLSGNLREYNEDNGLFSAVQILVEGLTEGEGFAASYHGQILPEENYTITTEAFPESVNASDFQINIIDARNAVLSLKDSLNLDDKDDFSFALNFDPNIFTIDIDTSNTTLLESTVGVDFVGPFHFIFKLRDQAPVSPSAGDYQAYVFYLDHLDGFPVVEVGFEHYGNGYILYSPELADLKVEVLCTAEDSSKLQFFNQNILDSLVIEESNFNRPGPGAYYLINEPYEGELYFTDDELANWPDDAAYFLLKITAQCGESYYSWIRMEVDQQTGSVSVPYISYYTEPNVILDLFPVCHSYGINPTENIYFWSEGIELADINSYPNGYNEDDGYTDLIGHHSTNLAIGETYPLSLYRGGSTNNPQYWYAWIDYNRDGVFSSDSEEMILDKMVLGSLDYEFIEEMITIRSDIEPGVYTLRIAASLYDEAIGCGSFTYGEVEDYSVELMVPACDGMQPLAPQIIVETDTICLDRMDFTVLSSDTIPEGFLWQWQLNGMDIEGANAQILVINTPGVYSAYFIETELNPCLSPISNEIEVIGKDCPVCLVEDVQPTIYAESDTLCTNQMMLTTDSIPVGYVCQWLYLGEEIPDADSPILWVDTIGNYSVYFKSSEDSLCSSPMSEPFELIQGTCETCNVCDDGNICTINDVYDEDCNCMGTYIDANINEICDLEEDFVSVQLRVVLQGAWLNSPTTGWMRDDLRALDLLPTTEPFSAMDNFSHHGNGGGETMDSTILAHIGEAAIVDWLLVELRSDSLESEILCTQSVLLCRDGMVIAANGNENIVFEGYEADNYYISVRHRNHLGAMTAQSMALNHLPQMIDFTHPDTPIWGEHALVDLNADTKGLWAGNGKVLDDKIVFQGLDNETDPIFFNVISNDNNSVGLASFIDKGYANTDINMDGKTILQGLNNDPTFIFFNILTYPGNTLHLPNFIIEEQLPE